jgi:hypothetical protein
MSIESVKESGRLVYVLSPVRQATDEQKAVIDKYAELLRDQKVEVVNPRLDVIQDDHTGYNIVMTELNFLHRIALEGGRVDVFWNLGGKLSEGSRVDIGMAKALRLELNLVDVFNEDKPTGPQVAYRIIQNNSRDMLRLSNMRRKIERCEEAVIDWNIDMVGEEEEWQRIRLGLALGCWAKNPKIRIRLGELTGTDPPEKSYPKVIREIEKIV